MSKSNPKKGRSKAGPAKPHDPFSGFPLGASTAGWWVKRIRGKLHYFGRWYKVRDGKIERLPDDGWQAALELYNAQKEDLHAGRTPRVTKIGGEGLRLVELCDRFLKAKKQRLDTGRITEQTFYGHRRTTDLLIAQFGRDRLVEDLAADNFEALLGKMSEKWGLVRLSNEITNVKSVFAYAYANGLISYDPKQRYGSEFRKPEQRELRVHRAKNGKRMLEPEECRRLLDAAPVQLKAMLLLGLNCGFGNHDVARLPLDALDLDGGWISFPRPKTGIARRCPMWVETVSALRAALAERPEPLEKAAEPLVFVNAKGRPWFSRGAANAVSVAARDLMKAVGVHRKAIGFYTLRHVFRTAADSCLDQVAIRVIMGHSDRSIDATYREHVDDTRLRAVAEHVRKWLFGSEV